MIFLINFLNKSETNRWKAENEITINCSFSFDDIYYFTLDFTDNLYNVRYLINMQQKSL